MITKYITFDSNGNPTGVGNALDGTLIPNAIACTDAQAENWQGYTNVEGVLTENTSVVLGLAQAAQIATLTAAYRQAIQQPVSYTSKGGVTKTYQADQGSIANLQAMLLAFGDTQTVPSGFYWVSADNTQVPFVYADMQGLAQVIGTQGATAFQHLQTQKTAVNAATTVAAVQSIVW
jgi:hypothetical protein